MQGDFEHLSVRPLGLLNEVFQRSDHRKPKGLWFSRGVWNEWVTVHNEALPHGKYHYRYTFELDPQADVLILNVASDQAVREFLGRYGLTPPNTDPRPRGSGIPSVYDVDWSLVASEWDGVTFVGVPTLTSSQLSMYAKNWIACLDIDSGCLWRPKACMKSHP